MMKNKESVSSILKRLREFKQIEWHYFWKRIGAKYYIIIRSHNGAGFFSNYTWVMGHIVLARKLGYIPVVDMKNYPTLYSEEEPVNGIENAWNYYFQDIGNITLDEAYQSGRYVIGKDKYLEKYVEKYSQGKYRFPTRKMIDYYSPIIDRDMRIRTELEEEYNAAWKHKVNESDCVLGIHIRGTDMKNNLGHPMPAPIQAYIEKTHQLLKQNPEITKIFLATDENNVKEIYEQEFAGNKWTLFMNDAFRVWDNGETRKVGVHETEIKNPRAFHKYLLGKEVLQDAWFLNQCNHLLCGHSNITNVVIMWNKNRFRSVVCVEPDGSISEIGI